MIQNNQRQDNQRYSKALETAFHFTSDDLRENRQGRLSPAQGSLIRRAAQRMALVIVGIIGVLGVLTIISSQPDTSEVAPLLLCLIVPAAVTLAVTVGAAEAALLPGVVAKRSGTAHIAYGMMGYTPPLDYGQQVRRWRWTRGGDYHLMVGEQVFTINRDQYEAIPAGSYVDLYILPTINKIVAVEVSTNRVGIEIPDVDPDKVIDISAQHIDNTDLPANLPAKLPPVSRPRSDEDEGVIKG